MIKSHPVNHPKIKENQSDVVGDPKGLRPVSVSSHSHLGHVYVLTEQPCMQIAISNNVEVFPMYRLVKGLQAKYNGQLRIAPLLERDLRPMGLSEPSGYRRASAALNPYDDGGTAALY